MNMPPLDQLEFKIIGLWMSEENPPYHAVKVSFFDQILISAIIKPFGLEDRVVALKEGAFARGALNYDPSDYEKMCLFADTPLIVNIQPLKNFDALQSIPINSPAEPSTPGKEKNGSNHKITSPKKGSPTQKSGKGTSMLPHPPTQQRPVRSPETMKDISCCNIDILPLFLDQDRICVKKRLEPIRVTSYLRKKSWDNLPLLTMSMAAVRNEENAMHHRLLQNANWMKISVVGAYNMLTPYNCECYYTAATKIPMYNDAETEMTMYAEGISVPRKFNSTSLYPRWETLRLQGEPFSKGDDKLNFDIEDIYNPDDIDLKYYLNRAPSCYNTIWGSFHRSLLLGNAENKMWHHLRQWKWPLEVHYYGDSVGGFSFMGFMDLFQMLYPGVNKMVTAISLHWFNWQLMSEKCNCGVLLMPNDKLIGSPVTNKLADSVPTSTSEGDASFQGTGADEKVAFVLVEVQFHHPMIPEAIPPYIRSAELMQMLTALEPHKGKRACRARGQQSSANWQITVRNAAHSLRRVPHHGLTDICIFNRQLSESRTRVELVTSFWMEAALFVNNNFVVSEYLESEEVFEELLMMAHVSMMKIAIDCLVGKDEWKKVEGMRAARHARQLNDLGHAMELYMQAAVQLPYDADCWRELSTCLKEIDIAWADVCLKKSLDLNIRHPLTLISQGCMVFEENADAAEPFFMALLNLYPFWPTAYVICTAYCHFMELFRLAEVIKESLSLIREQHLAHDLTFARAWERELGDFWDSTILLPGMSVYYDAADLLLRLRGIRMAEVCLGLALAEKGETAAYYHLLAICCRLKGEFENALCLVQKGIELFGQNTYFRSLEGECYHQLGDMTNAITAYEKAKGGTSCYNIMLSLPSCEPRRVRVVLLDLLRRQPNAYSWMALAHDWILRSQMDEDVEPEPQKSDTAPVLTCAVACAVQALKWDRRAGRAWALLAKLVKPQKRRTFCTNMASDCGYNWVDDTDIRNLKQRSQESVCHLLGVSLKDCRCTMCEPIHF